MQKIFLILSVSALLVSCKKNEKKDQLAPGKTVYYRVKMVDKNGHEIISQVRTVVEK